jgi:hypothetical protein
MVPQMKVLVTKVDGVRKHPDADRLTIVTVGEHEVVANLDEDGSPRWRVGEVCVYVPENAVVPEDVLKERGYWEEGAKKGLLGGSKGNRVKMQRFAGFESRGLLFKLDKYYNVTRGNPDILPFSITYADLGKDVSEFLGITEYVAKD